MIIVLMAIVPWAIARLLRGGGPVLVVPVDAKVMVAVGVASQMVAGLQPDRAAGLVPLAFAIGTVAVVRVFWASSHRRWLTVLAGAGAVANFIPIARYGAMPVLAEARHAVGPAEAVEPRVLGAKHVTVDTVEGWILPFVDFIAVPAINAVVSVGDVLLLAGFVALGLCREGCSPQASQEVAHEPSAPAMTKRHGLAGMATRNEPSAVSIVTGLEAPSTTCSSTLASTGVTTPTKWPS